MKTYENGRYYLVEDIENFLNEWSEKVFKKADKANELAEHNLYEGNTEKYFIHRNYSDGLYMALSMLSVIEKRCKNNK